MQKGAFSWGILLLVMILPGCVGEEKNQVRTGSLTVYFADQKDEALATDLAYYWREQHLLSGRKQDLELVNKGEKGYAVLMIANDPREAKNIPFEERMLLSQLRKDLETAVFDSTTVELTICNNKFKPIFTIN